MKIKQIYTDFLNKENNLVLDCPDYELFMLFVRKGFAVFEEVFFY